MKFHLLGIALLVGLSAPMLYAEDKVSGQEDAVLTDAPEVPPPWLALGGKPFSLA